MKIKVETVDQYLAELPAERRDALETVRAVIRKNLRGGYEEGMQYGVIGYFVPPSLYPPGYNCDPMQPLPFAGLASKKNHMSIHMMGLYSDPQQEAWFREAWIATGKKLDMGKACVRFKKIDDVPLKVIGEAIRRVPLKKFVEQYESVIRPAGKTNRPAGRKKAVRTEKAGGTKRKSSALRSKKTASSVGTKNPKAQK